MNDIAVLREIEQILFVALCTVDIFNIIFLIQEHKCVFLFLIPLSHSYQYFIVTGGISILFEFSSRFLFYGYY